MCLQNSDERFMREALRQANDAYADAEIPVGAVIVKDGEVIGAGRNRREKDNSAIAHAEVEAIRDACEKVGDWRLGGCTMYVTLEPCPMCAGAIMSARIERVVFGARDKRWGAVGSRVNMFNMQFDNSPEYKSSVLKDECEELLGRFFNELRIK